MAMRWLFVSAAMVAMGLRASASESAVQMHELVDFSRSGHCWRAVSHVANARQLETGYAFDVTGDDPWFVSGGATALPKASADAAYARFELDTAPITVSEPFQLFWRKANGAFAEQNSVRLEPVGDALCSKFVAEVPVSIIGTDDLVFRIDPPGRNPKFAGVEFRRLCMGWMSPEWTPQFRAPPPVAPTVDPIVLRGDGWELRHGARMGEFAFVAKGKVWAEGYPDEPFVISGLGGEPEELEWSKGSFKTRQDGNIFVAEATTKDVAGCLWRWRRMFSGNGRDLSVSTFVSVDGSARVYHIPYLTVFVDRASNGHKRQALLPGVEYLADEPSSNEKEVRGLEANRLIPAAHKLCYPMMVLTDASSWFAMEWTNPSGEASSFAPVFDSPDRLFGSGGHLFALWSPGLGNARKESDVRIFAAEPFTSGVINAVFSAGDGGDVTDALATRLPLDRLPQPPVMDEHRCCDVLAHGWLDSGIRDGTRCRHAIEDRSKPGLASDVPTLMLWLASTTHNPDHADRLTAAAKETIDAFPEGSAERYGGGWGVSHVRRPVAPLVFGDPIAYSSSVGAAAKGIARSLADGKRVWRARKGAKFDYGETLGLDHCNGYSAMAVEDMLSGAMWTGDETLITNALKVLDAFSRVYGNDVPRGAQPWEMPLHTPDILASGRLVGCYVKGYLLSGDSRYLEQARYWARTGMAMVYFVNPPTDAPNPVGLYATIGVIGATNWRSPNWIGRPVQWCGLVYAAALADLAEVETGDGNAALWRCLARGITASGVDQCFLPGGSVKSNLLPDSFNPVKQERFDAPINPGTLQENVSNFIGLPYYRIIRATHGGNTLVHVPGRVTARRPRAKERVSVEIAAWPKSPFMVFFSRVQKPSAVKVDGVAVPFTFLDNVMSVTLQPSAKPVMLTLEK